MLKTFKPQSKVLQKYIELYYVFTREKPDQFSYIAFPHINTCVSFFKGVNISRENFNILIQPDRDKNALCIEILGKYTKPVFVHYKGDFEEITIVFKPFGFNQFIRGELIDFAPEYSQAFSADAWSKFSSTLFEEETIIKKLKNWKHSYWTIFMK